jgi:type II secretion system protein I
MAASEQYVAAGWVAANQLESLRIARAEPVVGNSSGSEQMAGRHWHYQVFTESTEDPDLFRVDVSVYADPDDESPMARRFGYLRRPEQPDG